MTTKKGRQKGQKESIAQIPHQESCKPGRRKKTKF